MSAFLIDIGSAAGVREGMWNACLLLAVAALAEAPRFESATDVVAVDAVVVDDRGQPVGGLAPEDFTLSVDGHRRVVAFAEYRAYGQRAPAASEARRFSSNDGAGGGRLVVLVADQSNLGTGAARLALAGAGSLLDTLTPADRSALFTLPAGSGPQLDFTSEHARIQKALERVVGQSRAGARARVDVGAALAITRGDSLTADEIVSRECAFLRGPVRDQCANEVRMDAVAVAGLARQQSTHTIQGLRAILERLRKLEGPKTLILLSEGLLEDDPSDTKVLAVAAAAARVQLAVLLLDGSAPDASVGRLFGASNADRRLQKGGLEHLASLLGGLVLRISGPGDAAFARIASELSGRYVLGFEPEARERDGRSHEVRVQVRRPGAVVRARSVIVLPQAPPAVPPEQALVATLQQPELVAELPLRVATYSVRDPGSAQLRILVSAEVGQADLPAPEGVAVAFVLRDRSGRVSAGGFDTLPDAASAGPALFVGAAAVPPGAYLLKLAALDSRGRRGSVEHPLQAALTEAGEFTLSDLILSGHEESTLRPAVDPELRGAGCLAYLELYGREPRALDEASVAVEVAGSEAGPTLFSVPAPVTGDAGAERRIAQVSVPVDQLPAGDYVARAVVSVAGAPVRRVTQPFRVAR